MVRHGVEQGPALRIERPTEAELEWVEAYLRVAGALAAAYTGQEDVPLPGAALLDEIYEAWFVEWTGTPEAERDDPNDYINAVGLAFGQALVGELGFEWVVATDEHGTEIAVHRDPGDMLVFPPNLVAKRFEQGETRFLAAIYDELARHTNAV